jgi:hypothetical protein
VSEPWLQTKLRVGLPGIVSVETNVIDAFIRRWKSRGPFLLIGRDRGLALDTGGRAEGESPILWPPNGGQRQLWYFRRTEHRGQYLIVSIDNELVLDAKISTEICREPVMWSRHGESHQRWRLHPTKDSAAFFIESVRTRHVLDIPWEVEKGAPPVMWQRMTE